MIGISLTRTVTGAVHGLYEGTQRIAKGDFAWRIPVKGNDQLAELGHSFNNMTAQIENLVVIAKEKERLQSEVEIASEVQNQLFPRSAPAMRTIELIGVCQAARMVSGDYYDYLCLPDGNLALAIGDVAGKGISAALLMASIQSIMRTQLAAGLARSAAVGNGHAAGHVSTSSMVAQLNRQLYASTAPEKYATFFFGVYDEQSRILTYTNAGHLPPLLLRGGESQLLDVTGTVVGAFPVIRYEEQTVEIAAGRFADRLHGRHHGAGERLRRGVRSRAPGGDGAALPEQRTEGDCGEDHGSGDALEHGAGIAGRYDGHDCAGAGMNRIREKFLHRGRWARWTGPPSRPEFRESF